MLFRSIEVEVNSPQEIEEIFDEISYAKGGCVLRMLEAYVGEEKFRFKTDHKKVFYS